MLVGKFLFFFILTRTANASLAIVLRHLAIILTQNWRASLKKFFRIKVLLIQFFQVALLVIFFLVYVKCNFVSV